MRITQFFEKNRTLFIVLLIVVGAYFVFNTPVRTAQYSLAGNEMAYDRSAGGISSKNFASSMGDTGAYYPEEQRKIEKIANAQLEIEPKNYESAKLTLEGIATKYNGYYTAKNEYKQTYGEKEYRTYTLTFKVPVKDFELAIADLKTAADLKSLSINANDMTTQYYDTKAYLDNYKKEKTKLEELYDKADKIEDIIKINERLSQVQSQIDSYQMQLNNIARVTDYSTIYVTLSEEREVIEGFYEMTGLRALWRNVVMSFDNVFVVISNIIGFVVVIGIVWVGYKAVKKIKKK